MFLYVQYNKQYRFIKNNNNNKFIGVTVTVRRSSNGFQLLKPKKFLIIIHADYIPSFKFL